MTNQAKSILLDANEGQLDVVQMVNTAKAKK
jgi:hypothetical protein